MMETELYPARVISALREESGDEELSVLPRHTKVIVTGNNRTKSVLVGLQGVVKKAVGLGGWHWLVLKNGVEVKLQRNALSVLEHPTGNEDDSDLEFDNSSTDSEIGEKDNDYSNRFAFQKHSRPRVRHSRPSFPPAPSKTVNRNSYRDVQSIIHAPQPRVNLARLGTNTLWRYCRHYNLLSVNFNSSREQMLNAVRRHFVSQHLDDAKVIADFVRALKKKKTVDTRADSGEI